MGWMMGGLSPGRGSKFFPSSPCHNWLWGPPTFYTMDTRGSFPGGKVKGAWSWPLTPI